MDGLTEGATGATSIGACFDGVAVELKEGAAFDADVDDVLLVFCELVLDRDVVCVGELLLEGDLDLLPVGEGDAVRVSDGVVLGDAAGDSDCVGVPEGGAERVVVGVGVVVGDEVGVG